MAGIQCLSNPCHSLVVIYLKFLNPVSGFNIHITKYYPCDIFQTYTAHHLDLNRLVYSPCLENKSNCTANLNMCSVNINSAVSACITQFFFVVLCPICSSRERKKSQQTQKISYGGITNADRFFFISCSGWIKT